MINNKKVDSLNRIFKKYGVLLVYLFGSQKDSGLEYLKRRKVDVEKTSDLDIGILISCAPDDMFKFYGSLYYDLSNVFEPFNIDIVFLHEVNYLLKFEIIKGHRLYTSDEEFADEYEDYVMKTAADLSFKRKMFESDFLEALDNGYFQIELE